MIPVINKKQFDLSEYPFVCISDGIQEARNRFGSDALIIKQSDRYHSVPDEIFKTLVEEKPKKKRGPRPRIRRTDISVKTIRIKYGSHPGPMLKGVRKMINVTLTQAANAIGVDLGNLSHFENANGSYSKLVVGELVFAYAKFLGAEKIEFIL